jgi:hypothetical protein
VIEIAARPRGPTAAAMERVGSALVGTTTEGIKSGFLRRPAKEISSDLNRRLAEMANSGQLPAGEPPPGADQPGEDLGTAIGPT